MSMKIFICTDIEGVAGIDTLEAIDQSKPEYREACHLLMEDVNAAIAGAFAGGATQVYVNDGHGGGNNFLKEELDPRAIQVSGEFYRSPIPNIDAVLMVGCHAMAGTEEAFLDHTQSSASWFEYRVGGKSYGEIGQVAMWAGASGVPVVMVCGDKAACEEAEALIPGITCAVVKSAKVRNRAESLPKERALELIYEAARKAVENIGKAKDFDKEDSIGNASNIGKAENIEKVEPYRIILPTQVEITLYRSDYCDEMLLRNPEYQRKGRTLYKELTEIRSYLDLMFH